MWFVILSAAKYLYFCTVQRFFTFVQNDKFAYYIGLWFNCYIVSKIKATRTLSLLIEGRQSRRGKLNKKTKKSNRYK